MESNQSKQNNNRNQQNKGNWKPREHKDKPLNTLGDLYDLKKMCKEKGFKLKD